MLRSEERYSLQSKQCRAWRRSAGLRSAGRLFYGRIAGALFAEEFSVDSGISHDHAWLPYLQIANGQVIEAQ
jgi:hypothetical protein